jgi:hypothetical protein
MIAFVFNYPAAFFEEPNTIRNCAGKYVSMIQKLEFGTLNKKLLIAIIESEIIKNITPVITIKLLLFPRTDEIPTNVKSDK